MKGIVTGKVLVNQVFPLLQNLGHRDVCGANILTLPVIVFLRWLTDDGELYPRKETKRVPYIQVLHPRRKITCFTIEEFCSKNGKMIRSMLILSS